MAEKAHHGLHGSARIGALKIEDVPGAYAAGLLIFSRFAAFVPKKAASFAVAAFVLNNAASLAVAAYVPKKIAAQQKASEYTSRAKGTHFLALGD